jgi:tetratricopeptide (TPR) repeat protein
MEEFEMAIEHKQKVAHSYLQLAHCCQALNNLEKAEAYLNQALALDSLTENEIKSLREVLKDVRKAKGDKGGLFGFFKKHAKKEKP